MEDNSARSKTKICSEAIIRELSLIKQYLSRNYFDSILSITFVKEMPNLHTQITQTH